MKKIKRILAAVVAATMVMATAVTSFAEESGYTITINKDDSDKAAHTYGAFQIFTGDLKEETKDGSTTKTLSNIVWGSGVNVSGDSLGSLITELNEIDGISIATDATAAQIADAISKKNMEADSTDAQKLADAFNKILVTTATATGTIGAGETSGTIENVPAGYYLIKDTADITNAQGAKTRFMLQVVSSVTVTEKASVPTITKKVQDKNDSDDNTTNWQDSADYDIGDEVPYQITGTLPSRFSDFDTYKTYTITDTLSAGLTAPAAKDIVIKVGETDVKDHFDVSITGQTITISLKSDEDLRKWTAPALTKDSTFVVTYSAVLNNNAVIGGIGNPNTVNLTYSNNPNYNGDGENDHGKTPDDTVIVFTYKTVFNKVDGEQKPLAGAGFTLYKVSSTFKLSDILINNVALDKNTSMTPENITTIMNQLDAVKKNTSTNTGFTAVPNADGTSFTFSGVDDGRYVLVESTTPAGYNTMLPLIFDVTASHKDKDDAPDAATLTDLNGNKIDGEINTMDLTIGTDDAKTLSADIVNISGTILPSTGGIGTTILYVIGGILVIGGATAILIKRKKDAE